MYDTLISRLLRLAESQPDKLALADKRESLTYGELARRIAAAGARLKAMGVRKGERVLFTALSGPETAVVYLGIQYCGAVAVFLDKSGTPENTAAICREVEGALLLTDREARDCGGCRVFSLERFCRSETAVVPCSYSMPAEDETAELLFTTGTTGRPKGVVLTYRAVFSILSHTIEGIGIRAEDRLLLPLPLNHSFALRVLRACLYRGASAVLQNGFAFARELENNIDAFGCTALAAVPASLELLREQMQDRFYEVLGRLRYIEVGAGSLTAEQRLRLSARLPHTSLYNTWGSSECGGAIFLDIAEVAGRRDKLTALGRPLPQVSLRVLDASGNPLRSSRENPGRMALRGDMVMAGYWRQPELTAETLRDGWLLTGDLVYTDDDGYVFMLGRVDDIINVGGEKVSPVEVENEAGQYPFCRECACLGVPDPDGLLGQVPVLFIVPGDAAFTEASLRVFLASRIERYKLPRHYYLLEELPRNRMGKIDRRQLRALWDDRSGRKP